MKKIIIEKSAIISPLGDKQETVSRLLAGDKRVKSCEKFNIDCSIAEFEDDSIRDYRTIASIFSNTIDLSSYNNSSTLFIFSAAKGDIRAVESDATNEQHNYPSPNLDIQGQAFQKELKLDHANFIVISNACASGAAALFTAKELLENSIYKHIIIAGYEFISEFILSGFNALSALSTTGAKPFDHSRDGMSLGEGAAIAVLSNKEVEIGDIIFTGAALSNDANHRTGPSRTGKELATAVSLAIKEAGLSPKDIGAIKCHGTATRYNDMMESTAINRVFTGNLPPMVSTKGAIGHLSGIGSLVEAIIAQEFLKTKQIPPTIEFIKTDLESKISVSNTVQEINKNAILAIAIGFGGLNSALIFEEVL